MASQTPPVLSALLAPGDMPGLGDNGEDRRGEDMWIDVIHKMDEVYADLVASQVALEQQNEQLEQARAFMTSVLGTMTDVLIVSDAGGRIAQVNPALCGVVGKPEATLLGQPLVDLFLPAERAEVAACLGAAQPVEQRDWHLLSVDRQIAAVSVSGAPRKVGGRAHAGMVLVGRPIGDLQRAYRELDSAHQTLRQTQQQLLTSEKMAALGRLVAGVAHELNNPISFVFGNMYALKRYRAAISEYFAAIDAGLPARELAVLRARLKIDKVLSDIGPLVDGTLEGAERVRDIVQDLRRFSSNQREEPEAFNLVRLIHTAADWVVKAQRQKPDLVFDLPERLAVVSRKGQLHQILVNLVQNAVDALDGTPAPRIIIAAREGEREVLLSVADNGPGVARHHQDKIFEPFFTTKPIGTGTGLGLYVSYTMAEKLGGRIALCDAPGGGAVFTVSIPLVPVEEA